MSRRNRLIITATVAAVAATLAAVALATTVNFGNTAISRPLVDSWSGFSIFDDAATAPSSGVVTDVHYYAANTGSFHFLLKNSAAKVLWVSDDITPSAVGAATFTPANPVPVQAGDTLGIYVDGPGVIPHTLTGPNVSATGPDLFTAQHEALPAAGDTLTWYSGGSTTRDYSYNADEQTCSFAIGKPINADGSSDFSVTRTAIPVKLTGCDNPDLAPTIEISSGTVGSVSAADFENVMRYDPTAGQYIYNLATADLTGPGSYTLTIKVSGVTVVTVDFALS